MIPNYTVEFPKVEFAPPVTTMAWKHLHLYTGQNSKCHRHRHFVHFVLATTFLSFPCPVAPLRRVRPDPLPFNSGFGSDADAVAAFTARSDGAYTFQPDTGWPNCPQPQHDMTFPAHKPQRWRSKAISRTIRAGGRDQLKGMVALAKEHAVDNKVVLTLADHRYRDTLINWLHSMASVGVRNVIVFAMDEEMHTQLLEMGVPSFFSQQFVDHSNHVFAVEEQRLFVHEKVKAKHKGHNLKRVRMGALWCMRMLVIRTLLESGLSVVQSDADAVPLQNPLPLLARAQGDVVAQRGIFPRRVSTSWTGVTDLNTPGSEVHATLCFGFIMWKSTPATLALIDLAWAMLINQHDDQKGVQYAMIGCFSFTWGNDGTLAGPANSAGAPYQDVSLARDETRRGVIETGTSTQPIIGNHRLKVSLLPKALVPRHCGEQHGSPESKQDVVLTHCYAKKEAKAKEDNAKKFGVAFLGAEWREMARLKGESTVGFLQRLGVHPKAAFPCESLKLSMELGKLQETGRILRMVNLKDASASITLENVDEEIRKRCP